MNFVNAITQIISSSNTSRFETKQLLIDYFKNEGCNIFLAAEKAEATVNLFIEDVQNLIAHCYKNNSYSLFLQTTKSITIVDRKYFEVIRIRNELNSLNWQEFEDFCGILIEECFNATDIEISQRTADGGVDFKGKIPIETKESSTPYYLIEIIGQAKKYTGNVGRTDIDAFTALASKIKRDNPNTYRAQVFLFCTTSDFSATANEEILKNQFLSLNGLQIATLIFNTMKSNNEYREITLESLISVQKKRGV